MLIHLFANGARLISHTVSMEEFTFLSKADVASAGAGAVGFRLGLVAIWRQERDATYGKDAHQHSLSEGGADNRTWTFH